MTSTRRGPKPYSQRQASTIFVRVPSDDWYLVKGGYKREVRSRQSSTAALQKRSLPLPCVAYRLHPQHGYDSVLMVLEAVWREPLGAISEESLAAEGYATMAEFRRAWVIREKRRFPLLAPVTVHRVRPWTSEDAAEMGAALLRQLYGEFLRDGSSEPVGVRVAA
ncbi:MAG TPA: hypothetical protein VHX66_02160 [Solirubrobacteraceae bacterium]|jgi:hypothetical protein|nr:hypothetical protein [Solirubrobacteraceae bacterium]